MVVPISSKSQTHLLVMVFLWGPRIVQCLALYLGTSCTLEAGQPLFVQLLERFVEAKTCCGLFFPVSFRSALWRQMRCQKPLRAPLGKGP